MNDAANLIESSTSLITLQEEFYNFKNDLPGCDDYFVDANLFQKDFASYLQMLVDRSFGIIGSVPQTTYWYMNTDKNLIGLCSLRHRLTTSLKDLGGHIGYIIRPAERKKGHGTRLLALVLEKARDLGIPSVLLTTDVENTASRKIIERNGGILAEEALSTITGTMKARYWIEIK